MYKKEYRKEIHIVLQKTTQWKRAVYISDFRQFCAERNTPLFLKLVEKDDVSH